MQVQLSDSLAGVRISNASLAALQEQDVSREDLDAVLQEANETKRQMQSELKERYGQDKQNFADRYQEGISRLEESRMNWERQIEMASGDGKERLQAIIDRNKELMVDMRTELEKFLSTQRI